MPLALKITPNGGFILRGEGKGEAPAVAKLNTFRDFLLFYSRAKQNDEVEKWKENGNGKVKVTEKLEMTRTLKQAMLAL